MFNFHSVLREKTGELNDDEEQFNYHQRNKESQKINKEQKLTSLSLLQRSA